MVNYKINNLYQGGYSTFDSSKSLSPSNYPVTAGSMGVTTDPRTANVLKEVSGKLSSGVKQIEVEGVSPEIFESMPNDQLKEVNRLAKLTGVNLSLHGPVIDSAGFDRNGFSELNREASERKFTQTLERAKILDTDGNIAVNFHTSDGIAGSEFKWGEKDEKGNRVANRLIVVNRESGKMAPLEPEIKYYPDMDKWKQGVTNEQKEKVLKGELEKEKFREEISLSKGKTYSPEKRIGILNDSEWDNSINQVIFNKERADEILQQNAPQIQHVLKELSTPGKVPEEVLRKFPEHKRAWTHYQNASAYLNDTHQQLNALFSKAYEYGDEKQKKELLNLSENFKKELNEDGTIVGQSNAMQTLLHGLKSSKVTPNMYVPLEEFATKQSAKTFGNTAFAGWDKFRDKAPIVAIENPPAGFALSTGEDLKNLVEASRKHFAERLVKEEGFSEKKAEKTAEKFIGATWDVGHINMIRKQGAEKKHIIEETEKIRPLLKHVHLSDNFGFEHTELPMGMGNVPIQEIMEKLGKEGFEAKKIIEAGNWWQHFQSSPVQQSFEAFGSPIYSMQMAPYWNQSTGFQQGYFGGYGQMLPEGNYNTFGAGFSQLPADLGGQRAGGQGSRMSGRGME